MYVFRSRLPTESVVDLRLYVGQVGLCRGLALLSSFLDTEESGLCHQCQGPISPIVPHTFGRPGFIHPETLGLSMSLPDVILTDAKPFWHYPPHHSLPRVGKGPQELL